MGFADPIPNVTLSGAAQTLGRISTVGSKSIYRKTDGSLLYTVSHQNANKQRVRSMARLDQNIDINADLVLENMNAYVVVDRPVAGFTQTQYIDLVTCLFGSLTASTNAGLIKLFGLET